MKKILLIILIIVVVIIAGGAAYLKFALPDVGPAPDLHIVATPERIQRGEYLANHVSVCIDCHSTRNWGKFSGPIIPGTEGKGGEKFDETAGFPGTFYSKNITPDGLKGWTDGDIFRTITTGVGKEGNAFFPVMPYLYYGKMDKEDLYDIIAYIRTLHPIENQTPEHTLDFPVNFLINTMPTKASFTVRPPKSDTIKYGAYMTNAAGCMECHTKADKGKLITKFAFGGGRPFEMPNGTVYSANISPDKGTGIGAWTAEEFVTRFKLYTDTANVTSLGPDDVNTVMPWTMYAGMDTSDLRSIYAYLQTVKPIKNEVTHFVKTKDQKK